ncbi:hypothetical protein, partial [Deinococcus saxicola]
NPPYSAYVGTAISEEGDLVAKYKEGLISYWRIGKFNLDELYVRFFRIAERKIGQIDRGMISFITPYSYLSDPSFLVMRENFLKEFDSLTFDSLNGDSRETGKKTPDGKSDPSIFSTKLNKAGIKSGTVISLLVKSGKSKVQSPKVFYRQFWGAKKAEQLISALYTDLHNYESANPTTDNRYNFRPIFSSSEYKSWVKVIDLAEEKFIQGMDEDRAGALIDMQRETLIQRMKNYFDKNLNFEDFSKIHEGGLVRDSAGFVAAIARTRAQRLENYNTNNIFEYVYRPFDVRSAYITLIPTIWKRARPEYQIQHFDTGFFVTRSTSAAAAEGIPFYFTTARIARDALKGHAVVLPVMLKSPETATSDGLFASSTPSTRA